MDNQETGRRRLGLPRPRLRVLAPTLILGLLAAVAAVWLTERGPSGPGDELALDDENAYGWYGSKEVGARFTDGLNFVQVSSRAKHPLRLISARPLMDDDTTLRVLGVLARITPDMLPAQRSTGWFQESPGFPPSDHDAAGGVPVKDLLVRTPAPGEHLQIEIQVGYEVIAEGRSTRRGVELIYEYDGETRRVVIPSHLAICAPATVECPPNDE